MREWDFVLVRVGAIDVIEPDSDLRDYLKRPLPCFEHLGIDPVAQGANQPVNAALHFVDDQRLRRRLGSFKHFEIVPALTQTVLSSIANSGCGKYAELFIRHSCRRINQETRKARN